MSKVSVAVFGLNGALGQPTLEAIKSPVFADKFQLPILAVTRDASKYTSDEHVKYITGDYLSGKDALVKELNGVDAIVELLHPDPALFAAVEAIVGEVKPKVFIPSQFGVELEKAREVFPGFLALKSDHSDNVRKSGIKVVDIYTSFFAQGRWLYEVVGHVGGDLETKTVTYFGSPDTKVAFSSLTDIGRSIASLITKPASELPDKVRIQSGEVSLGEIIKRYEETHDIKFTEKVVPLDEALANAKEVWAKGFDPSKFLYYLQVISASGVDKGASFSQNQDELVNPGGSLWTWSKF
ncbi:CIC11C00000000103 [Sungouiella intermedia]|uniref:CIC11C00000000103 n=1 Tax=Sungouiella intermedia TaxID=45354 RepID=A0A1L0BB06_9ASCO|nr:CIC11C00000000103 [[Candida] intermedia]